MEKRKLEDALDLEAIVECLVNHSVGSACPNIAQGLLVDLFKVSLQLSLSISQNKKKINDFNLCKDFEIQMKWKEENFSVV